MSAKQMKPEIFRNLRLFLFSTIAAFLLGEAVLRVIGKIHDIDFRVYMQKFVFPDHPPGSLLMPDAKLRYRLVPNKKVSVANVDFAVDYVINSKGFRDKEYKYSKPADKVRIVVLGDSFTFGAGIAYGSRFADILEDHFANLEIINLAVPGYGLHQVILYLEEEGVKYVPDYVLLFINRPQVKRSARWITKTEYPVRPSSDGLTVYLEGRNKLFDDSGFFLLRHSYFFSALRYAVTKLILNPPLFINTAAADSRLREVAEKMVTNLLKVCRDNGVKLIIVRIDIEKVPDYLINLDPAIRYYDLTESLLVESEKYQLCFKYDRHPNPKTNAFIAGRIIDMVKKEVPCLVKAGPSLH